MSIQHHQEILNHHTVEHVTLTNSNGMQVELLNWGATLLDVRVPDQNGLIESVTLAYAHMADYLDNPSFLGCTVGRVAGRIAHSQFQLDGQTYTVSSNSGTHHLHGGAQGMCQKPWSIAQLLDDEQCSSVRFEYISCAGENGYPATLRVSVTYRLGNDNTLSIDYRADADAPTLCNLTNHAYFNLSGNARRDIQSHVLQVDAASVCAMSDELLVTGHEWPVADSPFDFRQAKSVGQALSSDDARICAAKGIDHYFILNATASNEPQVTLYDPASARRLRVYTDQPCVVLYAHNYSSNEVLRHGLGQSYDALCIETQKLPHVWAQNGDHPAAISVEGGYAQTTHFRFDCV